MMKSKNKKAQTSLELAIFGAILIFVMGTIIRTTTSRSLQQHSLLRATRMALTMSHKSTETKEVAGRNSAMVLIVEDRLSADSGKYGAIDRMPFMLQGSGTHSANLLMPVDYGNTEDLPVFDLFVNGKRFPFTTAGFKEIQAAESCAGRDLVPALDCPDECNGDCSAGSLQYFPGRDIDPDTQWEPNCIKHTEIKTYNCSTVTGSCPAECSNGCGPGVTGTYTETEEANIGCAKFFTIIDNHPLIDQWCARNSDVGCEDEDLDMRFDLNRDGTTDVTGSERDYFAWQWYLVMGKKHQVEGEQTLDYSINNLLGDPDNAVSITVESELIQGDGIILPGGEEDPMHTALDVDDDLKLEYIMPNVENGLKIRTAADGTQTDENTQQPNKVGRGGIIMRLGVQDPQEGDIDFSYNTQDEIDGKPTYGFERDVKTYTFVHGDGDGGGTYLQIDEGKLYDGDKQFIRTASKKDSVDIIERTFRVSNNTGRYCNAYDQFCGLQWGPTDWGSRNYFCKEINGNLELQSVGNITRGELLLGLENPVEYCAGTPAGCFTPDNMSRTCMDVSNNIIFVRSRIKDVHGRKWVTDESQDPYVEFDVNK